MDMNSALFSKIEKLLTMAERGSEHEKQIALVKAQKLMLEHRIEMADLRGVTIDEVVELVIDDRVNCYSKWIMQLSRIIAKNFRCSPLYARILSRKGKLTRCWVAGLKTDAEVCKQVLEKAFDYIQVESKNIVNYYYRQFGVTKGVKQDFIDGFLRGLKEAYHEQLMSNNQYALMIVVPIDVKQYVEKKGTNTFITNNICSAGLDYVKEWGYRKGKDFVEGEKQRLEYEEDTALMPG